MVNFWLERMQEAVQQRDGVLIASLIDPSGQSEQFDNLATNLNVSVIFCSTALRSLGNVQATPALRPSSFTSLTRSYFPQSRQFADFLSSYLLFARDADLNPYDEEATTQAYKLLEDCFRYRNSLPRRGSNSPLNSQWGRQSIRPRRHRLVRTNAQKSHRRIGSSRASSQSNFAPQSQFLISFLGWTNCW